MERLGRATWPVGWVHDRAECLAVERCGKQPRYNPHARPRPIRVQREFGTLQTLIDNRILQVQTVVLSRRRRLPAQCTPPLQRLNDSTNPVAKSLKTFDRLK